MDAGDKEIMELFQLTEREFTKNTLDTAMINRKGKYSTMAINMLGIAASLALLISFSSTVPFAESMYDFTSIVMESFEEKTIHWYNQISKF